MKFLYADSHDYVDPGYDFINDRNAPGRVRYWDDQYPHELLGKAPYDGLLVAMSGVKAKQGIANNKVRYTFSETQRFLRNGARSFLRIDSRKFEDLMMMGDCGAFAYADQPQPAYTPDEVFELYDEADFTHGCSPDHIIFDFDAANPPRSAMEARVIERFDISIENARKFLKICQKENALFEPMGAVQGWSPESLASSAKKMENMGYRYLAIGGLVPLKPASIELCLQAIRQEISPGTKIHLLGFAKAHLVTKFAHYDVASFDSTSPLLRAFKDKTANYFSAALDGGIDYFTAIRIPQALENPKLMRAVKTGAVAAEKLIKLEKAALEAARQYDKDEKDPEQVAQIINDYQREFLTADCKGNLSLVEKEVARSLESTLVTLKEAPWKRCSCLVCKTIGIEVVLFRASNRNKRRGMHNMYVFYEHLQRTVVEPAAATSMKSKVTATRKHKRKSQERVR